MADYSYDNDAPWYGYRTSITKITVEKGVTSIGDRAFYGCNKFAEISLPAGLTKIGAFAFSNADSVVTLSLPAGLTDIGNDAFSYCDKLESVLIPESVTTVGNYAFRNCKKLTGITFPASVESIGWDVFSGCASLVSIEVAAENADYKSVDGVLFTKDMRTLILYPAAKSAVTYEIPFGVEWLQSYAFYGCSGLTEIIIPSSVTDLGYKSVADCVDLKKATVYNTSVFISDSMFANSADGFTLYGGKNSTAQSYAKTYGYDFVVIDIPANEVVSGICGYDMQWVLYDNGELVISGTGNMADYDSYRTRAPWYDHRNNILSVTIENGVTSVGSYAFHYCSKLAEISLPDGLLYIGKQAFTGCYKLTCIELPDSLASIGEWAFQNCNINSITLPASVSKIDGAFKNVSALEAVNVDPENPYYTSVDGVLYNKDVTELVLYPVSKAGTEFVSPSTVTKIFDYAFQRNKNLEAVTIPQSVTVIGYSAFDDCDALKTVDLHAGVVEIGSSAFNGCEALEAINVASANKKYKSIDGVLFSYDMTTLIQYPAGRPDTSYTVPGEVTKIGNNAFYSSVFLTSVTLSEGVKLIDNWAFSWCSVLEEVVLPESLLDIGNYAFRYCNKLESITIPKKVRTIGYYAFGNCSKLTKVYVLNRNVEIESTNAFTYSASGLTLYGYTDSTAHAYALVHGYKFEDIRTPYAAGTCGDALTWIIYDDGELYIRGTGDMYHYTPSAHSPWHEHRKLVTKIVIASGVTSIGERAFANFVNLNEISIPENVERIGSNAFANCEHLTKAEVHNKNAEFGKDVFHGVHSDFAVHGHKGSTAHKYGDEHHRFEDMNGVLVSGTCGKAVTWVLYTDGSLVISGEGAMANYVNSQAPWMPYKSVIKTVVIESGVTSIADYAFYFCSVIENVEIPDTVTAIGRTAFFGCSSLKSITVPASVTTIGNRALEYCWVMTAINVDSANPEFTSKDGVLFNKDMTVLIQYPTGRSASSYDIPVTVKEIGRYAFRAAKLHNITVPESVVKVCSLAFFDSSYLETLTIKAYGAEFDDRALDDLPGDLVILGRIGSTAEKLAEDNVLVFKDYRTVLDTGTFDESGALTWTLYSDGELSVTGKGSMRTEGEITDASWYSIIDKVSGIYIGEGVYYADMSVLSAFTSAKTFFVNAENGVYASVDGVLFDKAKTKLLLYPAGSESTSYIISSEVTEIADGAFAGTALTDVVISGKSTVFGVGVFADAANAAFALHGHSGSTAETYAIANGHTFKAIHIPTVYLDGSKGNDENDGKTPDSAFATLSKAIEATNALAAEYPYAEEAIIVLCGETSLGNAQHNALPANKLKITLTSVYGDNDYRISAGAMFTSPSLRKINALYFNGDYIIENVKFRMLYNNFLFVLQYYSVCIGEGVEVIPADSATNAFNGYPIIVVGCSYEGGVPQDRAAREHVFNDDAYLQINSGDWQYVRGGSRDSTVIYNGTIVMDINGGRFHQKASASTSTGYKSANTNGATGKSYYGENSKVIMNLRGGEMDILVGYCYTQKGYNRADITVNFYEGFKLNQFFWAAQQGGGMFDGRLTVNVHGGDFSELWGAKLTNLATANGGTGKIFINYDENDEKSRTAYEALVKASDANDYILGDFSEVFTVDYLTYKVTDAEKKEAELIFVAKHLSAAVVPETVSCNGVEYKVVSVADKAFDGCKNMYMAMFEGIDVTFGENVFCGTPEGFAVRSYSGSTALVYAATNGYSVVVARDETASGNCGADGVDLFWTLYSDGELVIYGAGDMADYSGEEKAPWSYYAYSITSITLESDVASVGDNAFNELVKVTKVTVLGKDTEFGEGVFAEAAELVIHGYNNSTAITYAKDNGYEYVVLRTVIASGECGAVGDNVVWTLYGDGELLISGFGPMKDYAAVGSNIPWYNNKALIKTVTVEPGITYIGNYAFAQCHNIRFVNIGEGVIRLGTSVFFNSSHITTITLPSTLENLHYYDFNLCSRLEAIVVSEDNPYYTAIDGVLYDKAVTTLIKYPAGKKNTSFVVPDTVTVIGAYAFEYAKFVDITLPDSLTTIQSGAFRGCMSLTEITLTKDVESVASNTFTGCKYLENIYVVPSNKHFTSIQGVLCNYDQTHIFRYPEGKKGKKVVSDSSSYSRVSTVRLEEESAGIELPDDTYMIPATITNITELAFSGCDTITSIVIPGHVTEISPNAFKNCHMLETIVISEGVQAICDNAFSGCELVTTVTIPASVSYISGTAFADCASLTEIKVNEENLNYTDLDGVLFNKDKTVLKAYPTAKADKTYEVPEGVTVIDSYAFANNANLTEVKLPESVNTVGDSAFSGASLLTSVTAYGRETSFANNAFSGVASGFVLSGYPGSTAEDYASDKGITFGDARRKVSLGACGSDLEWTVYDDGSLEIYGTGAMTDFESGYSYWYAYKDSIKNVVIGDGVTSIGSYAFEDCAQLESVTLPESVTAVGTGAFAGCTKLAYAEIFNREAVFGTNVFGNTADGFKIAAYTGSTANAYATDNSHSFEAMIEVIAEGECGYAVDWILYNNGKMIISGEGDMLALSDENTPWAQYNESIKFIVVEEGITTLSKYAFSNCINAKSIQLPDSLTLINDYAFLNCASLTSITIPEKITTNIRGQAFLGCSSLENILVDENNQYLVSVDGVLYYKDMTVIVRYPEGKAGTQYEIKDTVTLVGQYAFGNCESLTSIIIPSKVTDLRLGALFNTGIESITLPSGFAKLYEYCLSDCDNLRSLTLPASVTVIGREALTNCDLLTKVEINSPSAAFRVDIFKGCPENLVICGYPGSTAETYAAENGHNFSAIGLRFASASLTLYNDIAVNFKVNKAELDQSGLSDPYVVFKFEGETYKVSDYKLVTNSNGKEQYVFAFNNLAPQMMNDVITATLYAEYNGTEYESESVIYSIAQYCYSQLSKTTNANFRTLLVDLLNYGAESQKYVGYKEDALVNAALTEEQLAWATQTEPELNNKLQFTGEITDPKAEWKSASLYLEDNISVQLKFDATDITGLYVKVEMCGVEYKIESFAVDSNDRYVARFEGFNATQLRDVLTATVCDADGNAVSESIVYSVESYAAKYASNDAVGGMVKAIMKYGDSAAAYSSSLGN